MNSKSQGGSGNQGWATPRWARPLIVSAVGHDFDVDVCASKGTEYAPRAIRPRENGLAVDWLGHAWCNPPWNDVVSWTHAAVRRLVREPKWTKSVTMLTPAHTGASWFQELFNVSGSLWLITPRLNYWDPKDKCIKSGIAFGSALWHLTPESLHKPEFPLVRMLELPKPKGAIR